MKTKNSSWRRLLLLCVCFLTMLCGTNADIIKKNESPIPGNPGKTVKWRAAHSKTPYGNPVGAKDVHFWLDLELKNPQPGDDVKFVVCAMLNVNKPKINMPAYKASVNAGTWICQQQAANVNWYPNYHFGCKRVRLHAGNNWKDNTFDQTVAFSVAFDEKDVASPYFDLAVDCPNGFNNCGGVFGQTDQFLEPGDGAFPDNVNGTSSWWLYNGGRYDVNPAAAGPGHLCWAEAPFHLGNWYTMAFTNLVYPSLLVGTLRNAPLGATVEFHFPPSAGVERRPFTVTDNVMPVSSRTSSPRLS